jgi:hypothetical protein
MTKAKVLLMLLDVAFVILSSSLVDAAEYQNLGLISITNVWRYDQRGIDLGATWREREFDDSQWSRGSGLLYYETNFLPAVKSTPLSLTNAQGRAIITYYFRSSFTLTQDATLIMSTVLDDGAVFYINGVEVFRQGMASRCDISYGTFAARTVPDATFEGPFFLRSTNLVIGENIIAVEVHQNSTNSSDIVFGLNLTATSQSPIIQSQPSSKNVHSGENVTFAVSATGAGPLSYQWEFRQRKYFVEALLQGVCSIASGGTSGPLRGVSPEWIPVVCNSEYITGTSVLVMARQYGNGRVFVAGHDAFIGINNQLISNTAVWLDVLNRRKALVSAGRGGVGGGYAPAPWLSSGFT